MCENSTDNGGIIGVFPQFTFDGYCGDIINYYARAFDMQPAYLVCYKDSLHANEVTGPGGDKIYCAIFSFPHGDRCYALKIKDSLDAALYNRNTYRTDIPTQSHSGGNPVLALRHHDKAFLTAAFNKLSEGVCAKLNKTLTTDSDGSLHGSLIDSYGTCWEFNEMEERS